LRSATERAVARTPMARLVVMPIVITIYVVGIAALAIVGGLFVAVCIEALVAPKEKAPHEAGPVGE
jgi:hypothetical protein